MRAKKSEKRIRDKSYKEQKKLRRGMKRMKADVIGKSLIDIPKFVENSLNMQSRPSVACHKEIRASRVNNKQCSKDRIFIRFAESPSTLLVSLLDAKLIK